MSRLRRLETGLNFIGGGNDFNAMDFFNKKWMQSISDQQKRQSGRGRSRRSKKRKSKKFERCVMHIKRKSPKYNPWAVCHANLSRKKRSRRRRK